MKEKLIIRTVRPDDFDRIKEIANVQWTLISNNYIKLIGEEMYSVYFGVVENRVAGVVSTLEQKLNNDPERFVVTEVDGVVAGFATYRTETLYDGSLGGILGYNAVDNSFKGRGIAGKQYAELFERMKKEGCIAAQVHTGLDELHAPARRAYEKSGFALNLPSIMYYRPLKWGDEKLEFKPTSENITVRVATPADAERIFEIAKEQWTIINNNYKDILGEQLYSLYYGTLEYRIKATRADLQKFMDTTPDKMIVTEVNGVVAGFATYRIEENNGVKCGILGRNGVDNNYKGRGIAGRQYAYLYARMLADGCTTSRVHTGLDEKHAPARRAYEKSGFSLNLPSLNYYKML